MCALTRGRAHAGDRLSRELCSPGIRGHAPFNSSCADATNVYVVELSKYVLLESKFRRCNPDYVGMTGPDPDLRVYKHKAGIQSNTYVQKYDPRLLPDLYEGSRCSGRQGKRLFLATLAQRPTACRPPIPPAPRQPTTT